jgi:peptidoglycan/LPS O-acetylase OafA/YrhL
MDASITSEDNQSRAPGGTGGPNHYRADIDGLRAVSITGVVLFHAIPAVMPGGFVGVDVFFVISGFLITRGMLQEIAAQKFGLWRFYMRRVLRIFPALTAMLAATCLAGWYLMLAEDYRLLGRHVLAGALFWSNLAAMQETGYFAHASELNPLLHLWSLGIEEQFYLLWPILVVASTRLGRLPLVVTALFVLSLVASLALARQTSSFYSPFTRFWELLAGAAVVVVRSNTFGRRLASVSGNASAVLGLALIGAAIFLLHGGDPYPGWRALLPVGGAAALLIAGPATWVNRHILAARPMVWIGLISYPLYLWHWPLLSFANLTSGHWPKPVRAIELIALAIVLSVATYHLVERPLRFAPPPRRRVHALGLLGAMAVIIAAGTAIDATGGVPGRFPPEMRALAGIADVYSYFDYLGSLRVGLCHGRPASEIMRTAPNACLETARPLVVLWGDSYAASLYPGLSALQERLHFGIGQFTAGNAPPFLLAGRAEDSGRDLAEANTERLNAIASLHPDLVIIAWMITGKNGIWSAERTVEELRVTLSRLHAAAPAAALMVIGPVPHWQGSLLKQMIDTIRTDVRHRMPPLYMRNGLMGAPFDYDAVLRREVPQLQLGATYVSALDVLCDADGCLTRVGPEVTDLSAVDWGHLTRGGSTYLISHIQDRITTLLARPSRAGPALAPAAPNASGARESIEKP